MVEFLVRVSPQEAVDLVDKEIVNGSITGEKVDEHVCTTENGREVRVVVYEKHYYRADNRLTLTLTVDNLGGYTRVHAVGGGGGHGFLRFDWGASESFADSVERALYQYKI